MKKVIMIISLMILSFGSESEARKWTDNWTVNGVQLSKITNSTQSEFAELAAGFATSFIVHWLGHVIYFELYDADWKQQGFKEIIYSEHSSSEFRKFGRAGFVSQLAVGSVFKLAGWNNHFTTGYHFGTFVEITSYRFTHRKEGDLKLIDNNGGNSDLEYAIYTVSSILLLDIRYAKD